MTAMGGLQQITHNGKLAALVIAGQAIIDDTLTDDERRQVQAMCLYALEIQDGNQPAAHTDAKAPSYAQPDAGDKRRDDRDSR